MDDHQCLRIVMPDMCNRVAISSLYKCHTEQNCVQMTKSESMGLREAWPQTLAEAQWAAHCYTQFDVLIHLFTINVRMSEAYEKESL